MTSKDLTIRLLGDLSDLQKKLNQASNDFSKVGATMTKKVTPAAAATAVALTKLGGDWNDAVDAIIVGTGASGDALDGLLGSTKKVAGQVPNDFGQVGVAIAEVNTRLGLTGPELETTTKGFLDLSRVTGTDVKTNIGLVTRVFGDWSVASEDQAGALDTLFAATQQTGIGIDRLSSLVVQFGAPMRQLGFSMEESIAIFGKFEKEGVNIEAVMSGLRMGLGRMAKAGEEPIDTFQRLIEQIKTAGSQGEANAIALEGFGQRAGPDMAAAIREGRFEIDDLVASLGNSDGALGDAADRTVHLSDRLRMLQNRITANLGPFGELGGAAAGVVAGLGPLLFGLGAMGPALAKVGAAFTKLKAIMIGHPLLTIAVVLGAAAVAFGVFGGSVDDSSTSVDNLAQSMRDAESPLEGFISTLHQLAIDSDITRRALDHAGVTTTELAEAALEGGDAWEDMQARLRRAAMEMEGGSVVAAAALHKEIKNLAVNAAEASKKNEEVARTTGTVTDAAEEATEATEEETAAAKALTDSLSKQDEARAANYEATVLSTNAAKEEAKENLIASEALRDQARSAEHSTTVLGPLKQAHEDAAAAAEEQTQRVNELYSAHLQLVGGDIAVRDAQRQAAEAMAELTENATAQSAEVDTATKAQLDAAGAAAEYKIQQAEASGEVLTAKERSEIHRGELVKLIDQLEGPVKNALLGYVAELDAIPRSIDTTVRTEYRDVFHSEVRRDAARASNQVRGASGAIVNRPTVALIGEAGPEAVVPLNRTPGNSPLPGMGGRLAGGPLVQIEHAHFEQKADVEAFAQRIMMLGVV